MARVALVPVFTIVEGGMEQFLARVRQQRDDCLREEPGCLHFDVLRLPGDDRRVMLYEIYESKDAIAAHRTTPHYADFKAATGDLVADLDLSTWVLED